MPKMYNKNRLPYHILLGVLVFFVAGCESVSAQTPPPNGGYDLATQRQNFINHINDIRKNQLTYRRSVSGLVGKVQALHFPAETYLDQYATVDGQNKLPDYQLHNQLNNAAQWLAVELANRGGAPTHDATWNPAMLKPDDRAKHFGWTGGSTAEAVSWGGAQNITTTAASEGWLQSTTHFRPFFWKDGDVFSHVGFGIATSQHGTYAAALFGNPTNVRPNFPNELAIDACECTIPGTGQKVPWEIATKLVIGKNLDNTIIDAPNAISSAPDFLDASKQGKLIADDTWRNTIYWTANELQDINQTRSLTAQLYDGKMYDVYHADFMKPLPNGYSGNRVRAYDRLARPKNSGSPAATNGLSLFKFVEAIKSGTTGSNIMSKTIAVKIDCKGRNVIVKRPAQTAANNIAKGKTAFQSTVDAGAVASRAVDNNIDGRWEKGSVTHTMMESNPYWWVDLGQSYSIEEVRVHGRSDCCQDRLNNYILVVTDTRPDQSADLTGATRSKLSDPNFSLAGSDIYRSQKTFGIGQTTQNWTPVELQNTSGRYVLIMAPGTSRILSLAEVEVFKQ